MLFNSLTFFIFLSIVLTAYWLLPLRRQNILLLVASYAFYAFWDIRFLFLITLTSVIDYTAALIIYQGKVARRERLISSGWLVVTCFLFVVIPYSKVSINGLFTAGVWSILFSNVFGWKIFFTVVSVTLLCNLLYPLVLKIPDTQRRRLLLVSTIVVKLGLLGFFKYYNFFMDNLYNLIAVTGFNPAVMRLNIILPVAISFYIFHTMSYTIDVYNNKMVPTTSFVDFTLFVVFFPLLAAGPIVRASQLLPVLSSQRTFRSEQFMRGLHLILLGLFKKVAIADGLAGTITHVFQSTGHLSWTDTVVGTLCFCIQIYCDFSGYSDIARGISKLFGIDIMLIFNLPYFSRSPTEFWTRWHISLSSWLRDYLYIPLGGNRKGRIRTYVNLMLTMFLGGLWHGAAWNFVLWGVYHGAILCIYRFIDETRHVTNRVESFIGGLGKGILFFILTCYGWLLFRAHSMSAILKLTTNLFTGFGDFTINVAKPMPAALLGIPLLIIYEIFTYRFKSDKFYQRLSPSLQGFLYASIILVLVLGLRNAPAQFIYFNF